MDQQPPTASQIGLSSFARVTIIGVGLLGASLGVALKRRGLARWVVGVGRGGQDGPSKSLQVALERGAIDEMATDPLSGVKGSDLVVVCTPVRKFPEMFAVIAPGLKPGAIVTDVGSTKEAVMAWAAAGLPKEGGAVFVGSHPMAGSEKRGPEWAREDLFEGAVCLLCAAGPLGDAEKRVEEMWRAVGMKTMWVGPREHDQWVGKVSHLPHAAAFALVNAVVAGDPSGGAILDVAGKGFLDTTRVAGSDVEMWTDIFLTNQTTVCEALEQYAAEIEKLRRAIATGDEGEIRTILNAAKRVREGCGQRVKEQRNKE